MVLAVLLALARPALLPRLLLGCIAIDCSDIVSAPLSGSVGQFDHAETLGLMTAAIAALVPETLALLLVWRRRTGRRRCSKKFTVFDCTATHAALSRSP